MSDTRHVEPGDNRLGMDVVVNAGPFLRGIKAARHFTSKKDDSGTYTCVRVAPSGSVLIISAANPLSMFTTSAQMVESAWNDAGVVDLPVWMVDQILAVFKPSSHEAQIRITTHMDSDKVRFAESTGLFDVNVHQWPRQFMEEAAPDVPPIVEAVFAAPAITDQHQLISPEVAHQVLQVSKIMQEDFLLDQEPNHYRFRIGGVARAIMVVPSVIRSGEDDEEEGVSALEDEDDLDDSGNVTDIKAELISSIGETVASYTGSGFRMVKAKPPEGMA